MPSEPNGGKITSKVKEKAIGVMHIYMYKLEHSDCVQSRRHAPAVGGLQAAIFIIRQFGFLVVLAIETTFL